MVCSRGYDCSFVYSMLIFSMKVKLRWRYIYRSVFYIQVYNYTDMGNKLNPRHTNVINKLSSSVCAMGNKSGRVY